MKVELANQYLKGIEAFTEDFPEIKGLYTAINTQKCNGDRLGVNTLSGRYSPSTGLVSDCRIELGLKSPEDLNELLGKYEQAINLGLFYKNASPEATAIHELTHGLTHAIEMKKNGYLTDSGVQTKIVRAEWDKYTATAAAGIVREVKDELYGTQIGEEVHDGMEHLGKYAFVNDDETVADAVSYEYINPDDSKEFSAKILEKLKKEVGETFK